jgi:hypothetical protein
MSLRTTPSSPRTLGPFEPSAGKGPAVSAGVVFAQAVSAVPPDASVDFAVNVVVVPVAFLSVLVEHAATNTDTPATPASCKARRREKKDVQVVGHAGVRVCLARVHTAGRCYVVAVCPQDSAAVQS